MTYSRIVSMFAAVAVTFVQFALVTQSASARTRPVVVNAPPERVTRRIGFADLNLTTTPGQQALNRRVGRAVKDVCIETSGADDLALRSRMAMSDCMATAWSRARPQIANAVQRAQRMAATGSAVLAAREQVIGIGN
jgi:UrcA family protein